MAKGDVLVRMKADTGNYNANMAATIRMVKNFRDENLSLGGVIKNMTRSLTGYAAGLMSIGALAGKLHETVTEAVALAKAGEGIRIAFSRLNDQNLLNGLREATHGTVTDIELMKAAVKFNDFKLPVEELGTMLAFAQQKAKDTGQSVDYMVESITNGLGRQSKPILDNLGISAKEIEERIKSTGDFTKAVSEIIRDQMAKAGDYVETAADRAAQANVSLQNKMEELGRKFAPLEEASNSLWTSMKLGILDIVGGPLTTLLNKLTQAGRMANAYGLIGGNAKVGQMTSNLAGASEGNRQSLYQQQQEKFWRYINPREQQIKDIRAWQSGERSEALQKRVGAIREKYGSLDATKIQAEVDAAKKMLSEYQAAAKQILQPIEQKIVPTVTDPKSGKKSKVSTVKEVAPTGSMADLNNQIRELRSAQDKATNVDDWKKYEQQIWAVTNRVKELKGQLSNIESGNMSSLSLTPASISRPVNGATSMDDVLNKGEKAIANFKPPQTVDDLIKKGRETQQAWNMAAGAVQNVGAAFSQIEDPSVKAMGTVTQAIASIALGFATASAQSNTAGTGWGWLAWVAAGAAAMATAISTIHSLTNLAGGGIVPGNSFSGDNIYGGGAMVNSGELVLNTAQQVNLANALQGSNGGLSVETVVRGEDLRIMLRRNSNRRSGGFETLR